MTIFLGLIAHNSAICHLLLVMLGIRNQLLGCQGLKMTVPNISLSVEEKEWWKSTIQDFRKKLVKTPRHYIDASIVGKNFTAASLQANVETLLIDEREQIYNLFLEDESIMNGKVVAHLIENRPVPKSIFNDLVDSKILINGLNSLTPEQLKTRLAEVIGEYAGAIFPYLYDLSLSSTNSRRSRAGQTFEMLIEKALDIFGYPYQNQSALGTDFYKNHRIGKKVDLIIPGRSAYEQRRTACGIVSAKTSLRERWQEVVEELNRSNVRHIYLATLDDGITSNQLELMKEYNITLIVRKSEKDSKFPTAGTVDSFDTFFNKTVPHLLGAWPGYVNV
jgi:hypothetical protein